MKHIDIIAKHAESIHHVVEAASMANHIEDTMVDLIDKCMQLEEYMDKDEFQELTNHCIKLRSTAIDVRVLAMEALDAAKNWAVENMRKEMNGLDDEN